MFRISKAVFALPAWISTLLLMLVFVGAARPGMAASATLVQTDTTTGGTWKGLYGSDGAVIANPAGDPVNTEVPHPYAAYYTEAQQFPWAPTTALTKALIKTGSSTERIGSTFYSNNGSNAAAGITGTFDLWINITDGQTHKVTLYSVDWEPLSRVQKIDVYDGGTSSLLSTTTQQNFANGVYSTWDVQGLVVFRVTGLVGPGGIGGGSPVVSGIFFGATPGATTTILNPQPGNVSGQIALTASVAAPSGVASVQFKLDGANVGSLITTGNPNYTTNWTANPAGAHNLTAEVTDSFGRKFLSNPVAINILPTVIQNSATFIKTDTPSPTAGDWKNAYGQDGHIIPGDPPNVIPGYLNLKSVSSIEGGAQPRTWTYTDTASDPNLPIAMQWNGTPPSSIQDGAGHVINNPARNPSVFYDSTQIAYDMDFTDGQSHQVAIYVTNFESASQNRTETITILNGDTNAVLDTQAVSAVSQVGKYYIWTVTGHVKIRFDQVAGTNLIFSGFYFGGGLQPPTVSMTSPSSGPVAGNVTFTANASSGEGNPKVQFKVDGISFGSQILAPPYTISWPTNSVSGGSHVLTAVATDSLGQSTTSPAITVSVNNPPPDVTLTFPTQDGHVFGLATLTATATSASTSIASVQFLVEGGVVPGTVTAAGSNFSIQWDSNALGNGSHTFAAKATDTLGQTTTKAITAIVSNGGPNVTITLPAAGPVSGIQTLTANAIQTQAPVQSVQFMLGNTAVGGPIGGAGPAYSTTLDTTTKASGTYQLTAIAKDTLGQITTSTAVSITISNPPPVVTMSAPSGTQAGTITLSANATSPSATIVSVQFKVDGTLIDTAVAGAGPSFSKQWNTGGVSNGPHTLTAVATDSLGQTAESVGVQVSVSNPAPTITITSPAAGSSVSGTVTIQTTTVSAIGVASVTFKLDGNNLGPAVVGAGPTYSFAWQSGTTPNGTHMLTAVALDKQGQSGPSQQVSVTVGNLPPTVSMTAPAAGTTLVGPVTLTATANSATAQVASVQFKVDGSIVGTATAGANNTYSLTWSSGSVTNTQHAISAFATDSGGLTADSAAVNVTVNNPGPSISIVTPTGAFSVINTVNITANATSSVGLVSVQFLVDGVNVGTEVPGTGPSFQKAWDTKNGASAVANGTHVLTALAKDLQGQTKLSAAVNVTVSNGIAPPPSATFLKLDTTTSGNWTGKYGSDGFVLAGDTTQLPVYITAIPVPPQVPAGGQLYIYPATITPGPRHLLKNGSTDRVIAAYYTDTSFTYDFDFTDGQVHQLAVYAFDQEGSTRNETISILNANTNVVLDAQTLTNFNGGSYVQWNIQGHVKVQITKNGLGQSAVVSGIFFDTQLPPPPPPTISLLPISPTVSGNVDLSANAASAGTIKNIQFMFDGTKLGGPITGAGPIYTFTWDTKTKSNGPHTITALVTDMADQTATATPQTITIDNPPTPPVITMTAPVTGNVVGTITVSASVAAVVGLTSVQFLLDGANLGAPLDGSSSTPSIQWNSAQVSQGAHTLSAKAKDALGQETTATGVAVTVVNPVPGATFSKIDSSTRGNWKGNYGTDGWLIPNDTNNKNPSYGTITPPTVSTGPAYTWSASTQDISGLQKGAQGSTDRIASVFYSANNANPFTFDVNITDGNTHELALYMWDLEASGRSEDITFLNANTNTVLTTQRVSNFNTGTYAVFNITGHVLVQVKWNGGLNAVIGGLFLRTLSPPPTVSVTAPAPASVLTGPVTLSATASATPPATITSVQFNVDGNAVGAPVIGAGPNFSMEWNSAGVTSTPHVITAVATDSTSQKSTSAAVNVTTNNPVGNPVISITNPAPGAVSGVVTVTANAVSPVGIASVQFKLDDTINLGTQTTGGPNYSVSWDSKSVANGTHTLTATAIDKQAVPLSATATVGVTTQYIGPSARFMKTDTVTMGNWKSVYGADGYVIPNDSNFTPSYLTLSGPGAAGPIWAYTATNSSSALLKGSSATERATSVFYSATNSTPFSFDMNFTGANEHELALYMWDREPTGRAENITILNGDNNAVLLTQPVSNFASGVYAVFNVKGHVIVRVQWTGGQSAVINGLFFATPAPPPPPPAVSITTPVSGATVTGATVALTANATANGTATMASVQFLVDGNAIGAPVTGLGPTFTTTWNSQGATQGSHNLTALATDSLSQKTTSAAVSFTTNNPPSPPVITITNPVPGPVSGVVSVTANAASSAGIASVQFKVNGNNLGTLQTGAGPVYSVSWDTTGLTGTQTLTAFAIDKNVSPLSNTSPPVNVTMAPPTSATFLRTDTATKGNWKGVYGADGYIIPSDSNVPPSYVTVTGPGAAGPVWLYPPTSSASALQKGASATDRVASAYYTANSGTPFAFDLKFTDGQSHELALYLWDLENFGRAENITILNADTNAVLTTQLMTNLGGGSYAVFRVNGHVLVRLAFNSGGPSAVLNGLFFATPVPPPPPPAVSITTPVSGATLTGAAVALTANATANGTASMASVQFLVDGNAIAAPVTGLGPTFTTTWNSQGATQGSHNLTALATDSLGQKTTSSAVSFTTNNPPTPPVITITNPVPGPVSGVVSVTANAASSAGIASVQFKVNGNNLGTLQTGAGPIYSVSWDTTGLTGTQTLTAFAIDKNVSPLSSTSAPVNVTVAPGPSATFLRTDTATKGNWKGVYGTDGYIIPSDSNVPPSYVTVTGPGAAGPVWVYPPTASPSGLLKGASLTDRIASAYYTAASSTPFAFDLKFTDGQPHELALYLWDLENFGRAESITILNGDTNAVLVTQPVTNFGGGSYAVFRVSGHILVRFSWNSGGPSAVLNGLFFATPPPPPPPPAVSITTPTGGASLTGLVTLTATATASSPSTMKNVQFKVDGVAIAAPLVGAGPSFTMAWDSGGPSAGSHILTAVATDSLDQATTSAGVQVTTVVVDTAPSVSLTAPTPGLVTGVVTVTATATSSKGIASVQFKLDGNNLGQPKTGAGPTYSVTWDTSGLTGSHFLSAVATDINVPVARSTESTHLNVTVVTGKPTGAFIKTDNSTLGNWKGVYGADGHIIPNDSNNLTAATTVNDPPTNGVPYSWGTNTWSDPKALQQGNSDTLRIASAYYSPTSLTFDVNFADIAKHELALYLWDLDGGNTRAETIAILDANTNAVLATQTMSSFGGGVYVVFNISGHVLVKVTRTGGQNAVVNGLFFKTLEVPPPPPPPPSVSITGPAPGTTLTATVNLTATAVANSPATMASVQFRLDGNAILPAVQGVGPSYSLPWNSATSINGPHKITAVAMDSTGQSSLSSDLDIITLNTVQPPTVSITSPTVSSTVTGIVTISATANSNVGIGSVQFKLDDNALGAPVTGAGPTYTLQWNTSSLTGQHKLTAVATDLQPTPQSTESSIVTVTVSAPANSAIFVKSDKLTLGNWKGVYGADGFIIPNDSNMPPGYATVAVSGGAPYTWSASSGDAQALQKGSNLVTERIASTYYSDNQNFSIDVKTNDAQLHQMALYFWDHGNGTNVRKQTVQILNADTNAVLSTQSLANFSDPVYLVFNIRGHVVVKISAANGSGSLILNAMFFRSFTGLTPPAVDITSPTGGTLTGPVTINANATSAQGISTVQVQLSSASLGTVNLGALLTGAGPVYTQKWATPGVPDGTYTLTAIATDKLGLTSTSLGYTVTIANGQPPAPSAFFVKKDFLPEPPVGVTSLTYGNGDWVGKYGSDGFLIAPASQSGISGTNPTSTISAGSLNVPYYVNLDLNGATTFTWNGQDTNPDQKPGLLKSPTDPLHYGTTFEVVDNGSHAPLIVDLNFIDNQVHQGAFYFVDWHHTERQMTIEVLDANTGTPVAPMQTLNPLGPWGTYLVYNLQGHVKLRVSQINRTTNLSPIMSGMFFGPVQ